MKKMLDILHYLELNNAEYLEKSFFVLISSPTAKGSLIVNLMKAKEKLEVLMNNEDINYHEKLIYRGKLICIDTLLKESTLYRDYREDKITNYGSLIEQFFSKISFYRKQSKICLKANDKNNALVFLSASYEFDLITSIIHRQYYSLLNCT